MTDVENGSAKDLESVEQAILFHSRTPTDDGSVRCLVCGSELQYLTHSHMSTHRSDAPRSVEEYKSKVSSVLDIDEEEVPVVSDDLHNDLAEKTRRKWNEGDYDHFRVER